MFEIFWTDPDQELVGEHRAKKELSKEQKAREREGSSRSSLSTRPSSPSSDKAFGLFGSRSLKEKVRSKISSHAPRPLRAPTLDSRSGQGLLPLVDSTLNSTEHRLEPLFPSVDGFSLAGTDSLLDHGELSSPSERDSAFSKWTGKSGVTHSPITSCSAVSPTKPLIQTLGPSSFVTRSTEVIVSARTNERGGFLYREVSIRSDGGKAHPPTPPVTPTGTNSLSIRSPIPRRMDSPLNLTLGSRGPLRPISPSWASSFKPNNPDAWKPPDNWDCTSVSESRPPSQDEHAATLRIGDEGDESSSVPLDLQAMERELKSMASASPALVLQRLRETWGSSRDPSQYQELEMEKKRWMLSTLANMDPVDIMDGAGESKLSIASASASKILVVHENKATTSYIAACHSSKQVYHLSTAPLSYRLYHNVHPLQVPSISAKPFPVALQIFGAVHSLSLPSLVPSQDIPPLLKDIHRCLAPGGIFHLTIIDPMPVASTLGHHMRMWLEENLLLNLERHFRCITPSKLFPIWLADNSLRAQGSTITTARFLAVADVENENEQMPSEAYLRKKLRNTVGRMLWTEVWGGYVTGTEWWWEDPACVQECIDYKTCWEYNLIEAVRGS